MAVDELVLARQRSEAQSSDEQKVVFEDGFSSATLFGTLFVAMIMMPGAVYLGLVAGQGLGPAAQWVTIVLFAEVARRSFAPLKRQEIYILFYVASALTGMVGGLGLSGGPFANLVWLQYFVQSPAAAPIVDQIPRWAVPQPDSAAILHRSFMHKDWLIPVGLLVLNEVLGRMMWMGLGYALFRITSDIEKLPFPMAPVAASGATALAEAGKGAEDSWRWKVFSTGAAIGLIYGVIYLGVPIFTSVLFGKAMTIIPIPFFDLVPNIEHSMPGALLGLTGDLGVLIAGFVIPAQIVYGQAISSIACQFFGNTILQQNGFLKNWYPGMSTIQGSLTVNMDFWMAVGIGLQIAVAIIGIVMVAKTLIENSKKKAMRGSFAPIPDGRGDTPKTIYYAIGMWFVATVIIIIIGHNMVPAFPLWILIVFGLLWTPLNSYISARMIGLTGSGVSFPFLKEASILATKYDRVDIWYAPIPINDYGGFAQRFREIELTRTKFTSIVWTEIAIFCVVPLFSFLFWSFFWASSQIPSAQYPYAQRFWPLNAQMSALWQQINLPGRSTSEWLMGALNTNRILAGVGTGLALYGVFAIAKLPLLTYYGLIGGVGALPHNTIPMLCGTLLSQKYFAKRFGPETWRMWAPVLLAGFSCGMGLIGMAAIALAIIGKSVSYLPY